jgi:hypothetical protein
MEAPQCDCIAWEAHLDLKTQTGDNVIKLLTDVSYEFSQKARAFVPGKPFQPSLIFMVRPEPTQVKHLSSAPL